MFTVLGRSLILLLLVATLVPAAPLDRASQSATIATGLAKSAVCKQQVDPRVGRPEPLAFEFVQLETENI